MVKSHGGANGRGYAAAIGVAEKMARSHYREEIVQNLERLARRAPVNAGAGDGLMALRSVLLGVGSYLPERVLTNAELAKQVDTGDDWIVERTGIRERRIAADGRHPTSRTPPP
ncbi:MAG: hypothetical protein R3C16_00455 [Hyphomonadaceae bacterium]